MEKTQQYEMAENLIDELVQFIPDLDTKELNPILLLDALGCAGLSLTTSNDASKAFMAILEA
jgi:hypothetical protein